MNALRLGAATIGALILTNLTPCHAQQLANVDLNRPGDATHAGDDGALSTGGTTWNGIDAAADGVTVDLVNQFGEAIDWQLTIDIPGNGNGGGNSAVGVDDRATNDLQDSGARKRLSITGLNPANSYTLVAYITRQGTANVKAHNGWAGARGVGRPTYALPGTEGEDYVRWDDLAPRHMGDDYGLDVKANGTTLTGLQLLEVLGPGACCMGADMCVDVPFMACEMMGGEYQGPGTQCADVVCPPLGACCFDDGSCQDLTAQSCDGLGGIYQGDDTNCMNTSCPLTTGACCASDMTCTEETEADCTANGGTYQGDATTCDPNPCTPPPGMGACCADDGTCSLATEDDCVAGGGAFQGDDTMCDPNPCMPPPATGACCASDETCSIETEADCLGAGSVYRGDGTSCDPNPCIPPPPTGACCLTSGMCQPDISEADCSTLGGAYRGDDSVCVTGDCVGACCLGDECMLLGPGVCDEMDGTYQGDGSACEPDPCQGDDGGATEAAAFGPPRIDAWLGDVNGDSFGDFVVATPEALADRGQVTVYSGATGTVIWRRSGEVIGDRFGASVSATRLVNDDGSVDLVVGAPRHDESGDDAGAVYILSGANGRVLNAWYGVAPGDRFGTAVDGSLDLDGDGSPDLLVGAPRNDDTANDAGAVYVISTLTGETLHVLYGESANDRFGAAVAGVGKLNRGPKHDFVVGAPRNDGRGQNAGKVYAYAGASWRLLYSVKGRRAGDRFGSELEAVGRVDDDNRDDFSVTAPGRGRIYVISGRDGEELSRRVD